MARITRSRLKYEYKLKLQNSFSKGYAWALLLGHLHSPLLPLTPLGRLHLDWTLTDLLPVGAQGRSAALNETFHHGTLCVLVGVTVNLLEELVNRCISTSIRIVGGCELLVIGENFVGNAVPVLVERLVAGRCRGRGGCGGGERVQRCFVVRRRQSPSSGSKSRNTHDQERRQPIHPT